MSKSSVVFFCNSCGNEFAKWSGQCPACHEWNTLVEATPFLKTTKTKSGGKITLKPAESFSVRSALSSQTGYTFSTGIGEFDRVLGPGLTKGGVYLLAGQPGIGKSTLLTQLALSISSPTSPLAPKNTSLRGGKGDAAIQKQSSSLTTSSRAQSRDLTPPRNVIYVCSEENPAQVATRITRLQGVSLKTDNIKLLNTSTVEMSFTFVPRKTPPKSPPASPVFKESP